MFTLLTGGARSGKSRTAVRLAEASGSAVTFVATATPEDDEMVARIRRHRTGRPASWTTVEEPVRLVEVLGALDDHDAVIVDCLALWVTNQLDADDRDVWLRADELADALAARPGPSFVVTNEVGLGIVPVNDVARRFRDLLGSVNQRMAARADRTLLCVAGGVVPVVDLDALDV